MPKTDTESHSSIPPAEFSMSSGRGRGERSAVYVTGAVKHFFFEERGKLKSTRKLQCTSSSSTMQRWVEDIPCGMRRWFSMCPVDEEHALAAAMRAGIVAAVLQNSAVYPSPSLMPRCRRRV